MSETTTADDAATTEQATRPGTAVRVVRFVVDESALAATQVEAFARHAGTARQVWNWAAGRWRDWRSNCTDFVWAKARREAGVDDVDWADTTALGDAILRARALYRDKSWQRAAYSEAQELFGPAANFQSAMTLGVLFTRETQDPESRLHWWTRDLRGPERHGVNRFAVSSSLTQFERAVQAFYDRGKNGLPVVSKRTGKLLGLPRFKRRDDDVQGFTLQNLAPAGTDPWRIVDGGHRIAVPSIGSLRVKANTRPLRRLLMAGGRPTGARFVRHGGRWTVSVNVAFPLEHRAVAAAPISRVKLRRGAVGVDLGVKELATVSDGEVVANPRLARAMAGELRRLQRQMDRQHRAGSPACFDEHGVHVKGRCLWGATDRGGPAMSATARKTHTAITRAHADLAVERARVLHLLTKSLTTHYAVVGIEDLNVRGMTARVPAKPDGRGGFEANGQAAKSGLNKSILDVGFGEFRRQLTYKSSRYGAIVVPVGRFAATSKTCSGCGAVKAKLPLSERTYRCDVCGLVIDRDYNAAVNIRALALRALDGTDCAGAGAEAHTGTPPAGVGPVGSKTGAPPLDGRHVAEAREGPLTPTAPVEHAA